MGRTRLWVGAAVVVVLAGGLGWRALTGAGPALDIETATVERGDVRRTVATSGAVRALVTVEVGSQLSGQLSEMHADFNTIVAEGDLLARIDPQTFEMAVREAEAARAVAEAGVALQDASVERAQAVLKREENEFGRAEALLARGASSQAAFDDALAAVETARADVAVAQAQARNARATLDQRMAALESARIDLERTRIRAPIDGVVVSRDVDIGQTVAASLSAPVLFTIAQDLTRVQIDAQVDEADIGQVRDGQEVGFTVDAYPDTDFSGVVDQIRLAAVSESNVVTYTVVISAENRARLLLPGMTANVEIVTGAREDVLVVDNRALRFEPRGAATALARGDAGGGGERRAQRGDGSRGNAMLARLESELDLSSAQMSAIREGLRAAFSDAGTGAGGQEGGDRTAMRERMTAVIERELTADQQAKYDVLRAGAAADAVRAGALWVLTDDGGFERRRVRLGVSDAQRTEIMAPDLEPGAQAVVRAREQDA